MLVHTNGKNQHAHTYSVKPAPTKLLPSKAEIRSLVVVGSSCQLPWQLPSCNPWNISSQPPTSQRNLLKLGLKAFDPERRNGRSIGQSMDVSNSKFPTKNGRNSNRLSKPTNLYWSGNNKLQ